MSWDDEAIAGTRDADLETIELGRAGDAIAAGLCPRCENGRVDPEDYWTKPCPECGWPRPPL